MKIVNKIFRILLFLAFVYTSMRFLLMSYKLELLYVILHMWREYIPAVILGLLFLYFFIKEYDPRFTERGSDNNDNIKH